MSEGSVSDGDEYGDSSSASGYSCTSVSEADSGTTVDSDNIDDSDGVYLAVPDAHSPRALHTTITSDS